ncbi:hypothetical protein PIB30_088320, partial [Stylosanthes scabra]|nr:hypothetical protein [Stylosanthes scabra]
ASSTDTEIIIAATSPSEATSTSPPEDSLQPQAQRNGYSLQSWYPPLVTITSSSLRFSIPSVASSSGYASPRVHSPSHVPLTKSARVVVGWKTRDPDRRILLPKDLLDQSEIPQ